MDWKLIKEAENIPAHGQTIIRTILLSPSGQRFNPDEFNTINDILVTVEAAEMWGIAEDKLKRFARENKFHPSECRRSASGRTWLFAKSGMRRVFGVPKGDTNES